MNPPAAESGALARRAGVGVLAALFVLTLRQQVRGRRLVALTLLFLLPAVMAAVANLASQFPPPIATLQFALLFTLIPSALAPLAALLYGAGMIQDEVEEQTLTYLLLRPVPRWALYVTKLSATILLTTALSTLFTAVTFAVIAITATAPGGPVLAPAAKAAGLIGLTQAGYCALFGLLGLLVRRSLVVGVAYLVLFEGLLGSFDTLARRFTLAYYFRVLALRWLEPVGGRTWSIDLARAPEARTCVLILLGATVVLAILAATVFTIREFRMKTPEGN